MTCPCSVCEAQRDALRLVQQPLEAEPFVAVDRDGQPEAGHLDADAQPPEWPRVYRDLRHIRDVRGTGVVRLPNGRYRFACAAYGHAPLVRPPEVSDPRVLDGLLVCPVCAVLAECQPWLTAFTEGVVRHG